MTDLGPVNWRDPFNWWALAIMLLVAAAVALAVTKIGGWR